MECTRRQTPRQIRTFFEVPCRNLPLTNPNHCNAFLCKHKSALHLPFWPLGPKRQWMEKILVRLFSPPLLHLVYQLLVLCPLLRRA